MDTQQQINDLKNEIENLKFSSRIPRNIQTAFEERLGGVRLSTSSHSGETKTVNESGSATYTVMLPADAFLEIRVNGTLYYIPVFT